MNFNSKNRAAGTFKKVPAALFLDLSKAFVCIHHETFKKLCYLGISANTMYAQQPSQNVPAAGYLAAYNAIFHFISFILLLVEENTMTILHNRQIAELIEAGCAFKSDVIISKNETKEIEEKTKRNK